MLSSLYKQLEEAGKDVDKIKERIRDTVKKSVLTLQPYLIHNYHVNMSYQHDEAKNFQVLGLDVLLDNKCQAWLMEINSNPSFNMFLEKELPDGEVEKTLSELDKYLKS